MIPPTEIPSESFDYTKGQAQHLLEPPNTMHLQFQIIPNNETNFITAIFAPLAALKLTPRQARRVLRYVLDHFPE